MGVESFTRCPGLEQALAIVPELFLCPNCGAEVEIWTDERKARCGQCGRLVSRDSAMKFEATHEKGSGEKYGGSNEPDGPDSTKAVSYPMPDLEPL